MTLTLARQTLGLAGLSDRDPARALAEGSALERFRAMVVAQGGDPNVSLASLPFAEMVMAQLERAATGGKGRRTNDSMAQAQG